MHSSSDLNFRGSSRLDIWKLTGERLHQHGEGLPRHIQLGGLLHHGYNLGDDWVFLTADPPVETDDTHDRRGVPFKRHDIVFRVLEDLVGDDLALIVLEAAVTPDMLQADAHVRQFAVQPPPVAVVHGHNVVLAHAEFAEHDHARP